VSETFTRPASFTVNQLADHFGCEPQLIYRRIRRGKIRAFKVGALWRIPVDEVARIEATGPVIGEDGTPTDDIEAYISALVAQAPPLTDEMRIRISAMLLTGTGGGA
jgi:excisionase family DNA binding protein